MTLPAKHETELIFRAFSEPTRLRILNLLAHRKELCVCDLIAVLDMPQSKVSRHLAYLNKANLIMSRQSGPWVHYQLQPARDAFHRHMIAGLKACLSQRPDLKQDLAALKKNIANGQCAPA